MVKSGIQSKGLLPKKKFPNQFLLSKSATEGNSAAERSCADDRECYFDLIQLNKEEQNDNSSVNQVYS